MSSIRIIEEDSTEPITLATAAANMRIPYISGAYLEASRITSLIKAARRKVEQFTGRSLIKRTVELAQTSFYEDAVRLRFYDLVHPAYSPRIVIPYGPVGAIDSVKYTDEDGVEQTLASDQYKVNRYIDPPEIVPAYDVTWPDVRSSAEFDSVRVRYEAGYSADDSPPNAVPDDMQQAMLLYIAHYFENREAVANLNTMGELPLGAIHLLEPYRVGLGV